MSADRTLDAPRGCHIPVSAIEWNYVASGGPGGQHANRSNTKVDARLDLRTCAGLPPATRQLLIAKLGSVVRLTVATHRSQTRNREEALDRFEKRLQAALKIERTRRKTKPSRGAKERRLKAKKQRSDTKKGRQKPRDGY